MVDVLDSKREAIAQLCVRYGVSRLEVFGSALREDFHPGESDVDLLVELGPMESYARVDAYFGMLEDLQALLGTEVDLVMVGAVKNRYIAAEIERTKQVLYAA
ncbi:MAG: nucleotidyltransferase domain-containing protein [Actinomycetes bacterium]